MYSHQVLWNFALGVFFCVCNCSFSKTRESTHTYTFIECKHNLIHSKKKLLVKQETKMLKIIFLFLFCFLWFYNSFVVWHTRNNTYSVNCLSFEYISSQCIHLFRNNNNINFRWIFVEKMEHNIQYRSIDKCCIIFEQPALFQ